MSFPVLPHGFLGAQGDSDTYRIERSLRFNSADSAYLSRTPASAGNRKTWTWSGWIKIGKLSTERQILSNTDTSGYNGIYFGFRIPDTLEIGDYGVGSWEWQLTTTQLFRDISSWYHIVVSVDTTQSTASNRVRVYLNGSQITSFSTSSYPSQNSDLRINSTSPMSIGRVNNGSYFFDGYLTEINFIDGQALTPSSFGETDAITGRWKAKAYSGTYGTNGFYLKFADNTGTTATTLGKDSSGNGNNWTPNNFSVTAGAGNDSLVDSPTNYGSDTGVGGNVRGNYCTLNPLGGTTNTIRDGNLELSGTAAGNTQRIGTIGVSSGKWYYETTLTTLPASMDPLIGFSETNNASLFSQYTGQSVSSYAIYHISSNTYLQKVNGGSFTNTNTTVASQGDIIGVAIDLDGGKIWFSKNGTWVDNGNPSTGLNAQFTGLSGTFAPAMRGTGGVTTTTLTANFGQRPFAYTAPSGFKALCTQNLPQPTIQKPSKAMDVVTYTGTGASRTVGGLGFSPDLVWFKIRQAGSHALFDIVRGANNILSSNTTGSELTSFTDELTSFTSDGFTLGSSANTFTNNNGSTYVGWSWDAGSTNSTNTSGSITSTVRANPQAGFSIVSYTGNGTAGATVGHGLGVAPKMIIAKFRSTTSDWPVYHSSIANAQNGGLNLNKTDAFTTTSGLWNNTSPTSSVFTVGSGLVTNLSTIIAYCFAEIEGYSKFGSYTGNGSADGPFVWCGFRPRWVMVKRIDAIAGWWMYDSARNDFNVIDKYLGAHNSSAEASAVFADFTSNGIKIRNNTTGENASGGTYIFAAFAESPFKYARAR